MTPRAALTGTAAGLAGFLLWRAVSALAPTLVPDPLRVLAHLAAAASGGALLPAVGRSLLRGLTGYAIALAGGVPLGLAMARWNPLDRLAASGLTGLQSLPSLCWFPVALLWFGPTERAVLLVVVASALPAVALSVRAGVRGIAPVTVQAARTLGARGIALWTRVLIPAALPSFLAGVRQGWAFSWRSLMGAELLSRALSPGVGTLLRSGQDARDLTAMTAVIGVILILSLLTDRALFGPFERVVARRWGTAR